MVFSMLAFLATKGPFGYNIPVALHSVAYNIFQHLEGCRRRIALHPPQRALWHLPFQLSNGASPFKLPLGMSEYCSARVSQVGLSTISKQQNRTRTTPSTVLETPPNRTRTKKFLLEEL